MATERDNVFDDALADEYALLYYAYPHHDEFQAEIAKTLVSRLADPDGFVLEAGAGSGVTTEFLLKASSSMTIIALDSSEKMLEQAEENLADYAQVVFVLDDLLACLKQQPDESLDGFVAAWTLHNLLPDYRKELFPEIYRVLKPGGAFVSGDKYSVADEEQHQAQLLAQLDRFRDFCQTNQVLADDWVKHNLEDETIRISEQEQHEILNSLGFSDVRTVYRNDMEAIITAIR